MTDQSQEQKTRRKKDKQTDLEPKQRTPKGLEIPVPKWREVMRDLEKVAKGEKPTKG